MPLTPNHTVYYIFFLTCVLCIGLPTFSIFILLYLTYASLSSLILHHCTCVSTGVFFSLFYSIKRTVAQESVAQHYLYSESVLSLLYFITAHVCLPGFSFPFLTPLKGLSHEIGFKNFDKNLQNLT